MKKSILILIFLFTISFSGEIFAQATQHVQNTNLALPKVSVDFSGTNNNGDIVSSIKIVILMTILTLAPSILIMMTGFTRIIIVLSFLRRALGTQTMPPNQLLVGFSLFLTFFIMSPVINDINKTAFQPFVKNEIKFDQFLELSSKPLKHFMLKQTREKDLALFVKVSKSKRPKTIGDLEMKVIIPAFIISELKRAFEIGFLLYIPFLLIDMVIASILMSMGMMMLPPVMISMPFKIVLFILVDGWHLIVNQLILSFR